MPEEGLAVCEVCFGGAGIGGGIVPAALGQAFFGEVFEFAWVFRVDEIWSAIWGKKVKSERKSEAYRC